MKLGLFGGSFDPIHRGHVEPVLDAARALGLARVLYLPTARPPHKTDQALAPAAARYAMVEMALLEHPELRVDDFEMRADGPSYTIDTVRHFQKVSPDARLHYLIGGDALPGLPTWRSAEELLRRVDLVVLARPGWRLDEALDRLSPDTRSLLAAASVHRIDNRLCDVSSTRLREQLARGAREEARHALDPLVLRYALKYGLYQASDA
ncbi:MAG: nicotinate-nucleotide adenylyltransferase [Thermoanaerobaculia bacterium]